LWLLNITRKTSTLETWNSLNTTIHSQCFCIITHIRCHLLSVICIQCFSVYTISADVKTAYPGFHNS
jgi:hypothetical protein